MALWTFSGKFQTATISSLHLIYCLLLESYHALFVFSNVSIHLTYLWWLFGFLLDLSHNPVFFHPAFILYTSRSKKDYNTRNKTNPVFCRRTGLTVDVLFILEICFSFSLSLKLTSLPWLINESVLCQICLNDNE